MSQIVTNGGLWGDFTIIFLNIPIFTKTNICIVYNKCLNNDEMWEGIYDSKLVIHLAFGNQHFEPIQIMTSCNLETKKITNRN
jgi:hypothetical protein